jgi:hypothetical protein
LYGVFSCDFKEWMRSWSKKKVYISLFTLIFFYSFVATTIYASGPDIRVVSRDEYLSAEYLARYQESGQNACVLADTWILLPLEGLSRGTVVGGGFPIGANFGQAERVELYNEFLKNPDARIIPKIFAVVPSESCFVVVSQNDIDPRKEVLIHELLGNAVMKFGDILIWKMELKK